MWLTAAATVFATGVWSLSPFGAETPDAAASATFRSIGSASRKAPAPGAGIATATPARVANAALVKSAGAPALAAASFSDVKFLAVNGSRTSASDVVLQFFEKEVGVQFRDGSPALAALPYRRISKATYAQGRDPQWDASLSGPAGKIDVPGFMGRARHWLVLQSQDRYVILRLDGNDRLDVMKAFEERAGVVIDRK
jgi:hypothetical protein